MLDRAAKQTVLQLGSEPHRLLPAGPGQWTSYADEDMNTLLTRHKAPAIAAFAALAIAGCWRVDPGTSGGGGSGGDVLQGTDDEVCGGGCSTLIDCGIELDQAGCKDSCINAVTKSLVGCFRQVTATCDNLSSCVLSEVCSGNVPSGSASCETGQSCLISCAGNPDPGCGCTCIPQVSPDQSAAIYALAVCANVHCSLECGTSGDPGSCQSCMANECETDDLGCN